jgi:hypothetical protein
MPSAILAAGSAVRGPVAWDHRRHSPDQEPPAVRKHLFDIAEACALIHGYASVANEVVWGVVEGNLGALRREVQALLDEP